MKTKSAERVRVEISAETLKRLLSADQVCAADLNCLDGESKKCLMRLCLESCARKASSGGQRAAAIRFPGSGRVSSDPISHPRRLAIRSIPGQPPIRLGEACSC